MEVQIYCILKNSQGDIIWLETSDVGHRYTVNEIINLMGSGYTFFVDRNGQKTPVYSKQDPSTGRWFLTTEPNSMVENNLYFLPRCSPRG
jgi:hypothetical protein